jgi:hypothetical protein
VVRGSKKSSRAARLLPLFVLLSTCAPLQAQPFIPPQRDPLINMLMAQPKIDLSGPVKATAVFEPPVIGQGEQAFYRVSFNALEQSVILPQELPVPKELKIRPRARGQVLQMMPPVMVPVSMFNFRIEAGGQGRIVIPSFQATVYGTNVTVPAAELSVVSTPTPIAALPPRLTVEIPVKKLFVGQSAAVSVFLPGWHQCDDLHL